MEFVGAFLEEDWESLSRLMFFTEEADFMPHLLHSHDYKRDNGFIFGASSTVWPIDEANVNMSGVDESLFYSSSDTFSSNFHYYFSQESSNSSGSNSTSPFFPTLSPENYHSIDSNHIPETNNTHLEPMNFCAFDNVINAFSVDPVFPDNVMEDFLCLKEKIDGQQPPTIAGKELQLKRKSDMPELQARVGDTSNGSSEIVPKKKSRVSRDAQKGNKKKNATSKKNQKLTPNGSDEEEEEEETNIIIRTIGQCSSGYNSEDDDSNASHQEPNLSAAAAASDSKGSAALNSNGKSRASRGAATDPQSLYARKRRERINERLRILQNLVPNGTKVDISTMLEEAVHYVKFLQLQIKLLSSDEMWMYAPIAYNGMDIGLFSKISPTL